MAVRAISAVGLAFLVACLASARAAAQQPAPAGTVLGVVLDRVSGAPVSGALVTVDGASRAITDSLGAFLIQGVPPGERRMIGRRFGYEDLEQPIAVRDSRHEVTLYLSPVPLPLDELLVAGSARVALPGRVLDRISGAPIPFVRLSLTRDAVRDAVRGATDTGGVFLLDDVETGSYFLRVERLGYVSQYVPLRVSLPPVPVDLHLVPDSSMMAGLNVMTKEYRTRRNATPYLVRAYDEKTLRSASAPDVRHFLTYHTSIAWTGCATAASMDCVFHRGGTLVPRVYIDESIRTLDELRSYDTEDLFQLEVFTCSRRIEIRAYTYAHVEAVARRPRIPLAACSFW